LIIKLFIYSEFRNITERIRKISSKKTPFTKKMGSRSGQNDNFNPRIGWRGRFRNSDKQAARTADSLPRVKIVRADDMSRNDWKKMALN
jgi:hypothetical protein